MKDEIIYKPFGELLIEIIDNRGKTCPTVNSGIPLIATNCIKNENLFPVFEKVRYLSQDTYDNWFRGHPQPGDMIFVTKGTPGRVCWVPNPVNFCIAQDMVAIRANEEKVYSKYLFVALRSKRIQDEIENLHVGSLIPHFKKGDFNDLQIPIPDLDTQKYIGNLYFDTSLKIDLLRRQTKTLEALAETLFRQWFMEEADERWKAGKLGDVISILDSKRVPLSNLERDKMKIGALYPYYGAATIMDYINDYLFDGEYILMGEDGTVQTLGGYPILQMATGKFWVNNHAHIFQAVKPYSNFSIYIFLKQTNISNIITGAVQPKINQENLRSIEFPMPPDDKVSEFVIIINSCWEKMKTNIEQIHTLTGLCDTLLPRLMSGEVIVKM